MGVYIPGVKLPDHGQVIYIFPDGTWQKAFLGSREPFQRGIAVPVPPHGRLGDLDAAVSILERLRDHCGNEDMAYALNWAANTIKDLPTIIQAEEEP